MPLVVVPGIIVVFVAIHREYARVSKALDVDPSEKRPRRVDHTVVVLVGRVHLGVLEALDYAQSLRPDHLVALYISDDDDDREAMKAQWREFDIEVPLDIKHSSYRELTGPVLDGLDGLDERCTATRHGRRARGRRGQVVRAPPAHPERSVLEGRLPRLPLRQ